MVEGGVAVLHFKNCASSGYSIFLHSGGATRLLTTITALNPNFIPHPNVSVFKVKTRWRS